MPPRPDEENTLGRQDPPDNRNPPAKPKTEVPKYGDTSATYWKLYESEAKNNDNNLVDSLKGNTNSMVILSTLFSSIVASFIIEIYKTLLPGNSQPSGRSVRINILLCLSFFLSITSAVSCTLIQQWCDEYLNLAYPRAAPHQRGHVRTYLYQGLDQFQMRRFMYGIYVLLHLSVFLFFLALADFFYTVHHLLGIAALCALVVSVTDYMLLSISPLIFSSSPYNTPMTPSLRAGYFILLTTIRWCLRVFRRGKSFKPKWLRYYKGIHFDRALLCSIKAEEQAEKLESYAMKWLFTENDFSDDDMDKFLEGLPGYMSSEHTEKGRLDQDLVAEHVLHRIKEHFISCATSVELSDDKSTSRVDSCVKALVRIFQYSRKDKQPDRLEVLGQLQQEYMQGLIDYFKTLYITPAEDPTIALRASCIRALASQGLLSHLTAQDEGKTPPAPVSTVIPPVPVSTVIPPVYVSTVTPLVPGSMVTPLVSVSTVTSPVPVSTHHLDRPFPASLIPIYKFFFPRDNTDTMHAGEMRKKLLSDGPLANLTMLAQAICEKEHAPASTLSFCWKALDILLTQLGTSHSENFSLSQQVFNDLHKKIRTYVLEGRGFRVAPLLDILDTVSRGRRLLMVFSGHPKYHNRADVVFGKDYLRNGDLLEAFAHCLPIFISNNPPEVCRKFMEEVVREDHLWASLQENLRNTQSSDSPTHVKLRIFEDCCTVIDLAFSVLEESEKVDWRAPEFGSLAQHFESFIAHCFKDAFMERATSFRVGVIKARFCKALLSQFRRDLDSERTVSFRSQWDVASLARLICTLGLRDNEDPEFWNSYVDGGYIGAEFTAKALDMIDMATRDGPLLIFCVLGHLAASAVPLEQSGLKDKDIEKLRELQAKVIDKPRVPLDPTSDTVREKVGQLRNRVEDLLRGRDTGKGKEILDDLLQKIDDVFPSSAGPGQSEPAEEQGPRNPATVKPTLSSGESRGDGSRPTGLASESTAVTGGPSSGTQTGEGEDGFEQPFVDKDLDRERRPYVRSESPQSHDSGFQLLPSPPLTAQGVPGSGVINQSIGTFPSPFHFPYMGDARLRPATRRTGSGSSTSSSGVTRPSTVTRTSAGALLMSPRFGSLDLREEGQSGAVPSESSGSPGSL